MSLDRRRGPVWRRSARKAPVRSAAMQGLDARHDYGGVTEESNRRLLLVDLTRAGKASNNLDAILRDSGADLVLLGRSDLAPILAISATSVTATSRRPSTGTSRQPETVGKADGGRCREDARAWGRRRHAHAGAGDRSEMLCACLCRKRLVHRQMFETDTSDSGFEPFAVTRTR